MPGDKDFSSLFHQISKRSRGSIPFDSSTWPAAWSIVQYKSYPRFPHLSLEKHSLQANLADGLQHRKSVRDFTTSGITKEQLSALLQYACGLQHGTHRTHPSAGGRYPLEVYPIVARSDGSLAPGLYHYNIKDHTLDVLFPQEVHMEKMDSFFTYPWAKNASMALILTGVFSRMTNKYADRGYRNVLIEAGHVGQNLYLVAEALGLKCTAIAGTRDERIEEFLDIDGVTESLVYAFLFD